MPVRSFNPFLEQDENDDCRLELARGGARQHGRALGEANPGRPMATPAETVDAYCVDWCKARCEALGADAKDAWRPEVRAPSTIIAPDDPFRSRRPIGADRPRSVRRSTRRPIAT